MKIVFEMSILAGLAMAQQEVMIFDRAVVPSTGALPMTRTFLRSSGGIVKGAPYSAESVNEHTQILADGNRIKHTNKSSFARDADGRTRIESTIQGLGLLGKMEEPVVSIFIEDPVANLHFTLDSKRKVAMKSKTEAGPEFRWVPKEGGKQGIPENVMVERRMITTEGGGTHRMEAKIEVNSVRRDGNVKQEDLGTRTIEGVSAKGLKTTMTIAAGEVGNERPIEVVTETW